MKRIIVAVFMLLLLFLHIPSVSAKCLDFEGQYSFYTKSFYRDEHCTTVKNGNIYIISCASQYADKLKTKLSDIIGESVTMAYEGENFFKIASQLGEIYFNEAIGDICIAEGYSAELAGGVLKQNKKINFQAAYDGKYLTIGTPMILGSF